VALVRPRALRSTGTAWSKACPEPDISYTSRIENDSAVVVEKPPTPSSTPAPLDWPVLIFILVSPVLAILGTVWWAASGRFHWATIVFAVVAAIVTGLSITAGYHRLYAHRAFAAPWPVRLALLLAACAGFENSALIWVQGHRKHHRYLDGPGDPYNIRRGFGYAHLFWMFRKVQWQHGEFVAPDIAADPLVSFQHRWYILLAGLLGLVAPAAIAWLWGDPWGGFFVAGLARIVANHHCTFAINSVCHTFGSQPYSDRHSARDHWLTATLTYGEGYHNFHHEFPSDYRNGHKPWHFDPTKWLIAALAWLRLASSLRAVSDDAIARRRAR